ncbi:histidinol-phosphate transaminase [Sciscionella marina]|uniref:histidinol-phosphate transaminase n=1 Tax=Sciscionella marina TaxID=508770 RepID=UPI0003606B10|nr:histidinol-phosphate transaminase [Sciscionella marina]
MTSLPRADLATLPAYVPGKTIQGAIKLASNEVSAGPLPSVRAAIAEAAAGVNRYPDTGSQALVSRLAERFDLEPGRVVVGCGSVSLCQMVIQATCTPADAVLFGWRSFEAYPILSQVVGTTQITVPTTPEHALDVDALLAAITPETRVVFLCSPNNPTGTTLTGAELTRFVESAPEHVLIVLDEAYREFVDDPEVPDGIEFAKRCWAEGRENIAVLRTFSKAYGLAGIRVGYCAAPVPVAEALRKVAVPFAVNMLAQTAAIASLDAEEELMARCREIIAERARVRSALQEYGYEVPPSQANFVWLPLGARTAAFDEHCLGHKVIVRAFADSGARITIGTREENDALLEAARTFAG